VKMKSEKEPNSEVDLSKFFEKEVSETPRAATIQPMDLRIGNEKKQGSLVLVVVVNFIIGAAIFSYYIVKSNTAASVKPVSIQSITAPVNYTAETGEEYKPPLP